MILQVTMERIEEVFKLMERIDSSYRDYVLLYEGVLLEAASLADVHEKYYNQIPEEEFKQIVASDPTAGEDKMGKYSKWLLALYTGGNLKLEDLYKATKYLTIFDKYKGKIEKKDIGQYKSLPELYRAIQPYEDNTQAASHKEEIRQIKKGAEKVYEDDEWLVVVPHTQQAAIEYGRGTQWCTAATDSYNYFNHYNKEGPLYININKNTGKKFQFHFESQQFMDEEDCGVNFHEIGLSDGLTKFYIDRYGNLTNGYCEKQEHTNYYTFDDGDKVFIVDRRGRFVNDDGYDLVYNANEVSGCAIVEFEDKVNIINNEGELISPNQWFDDVETIDYQFKVELNGKYNFINEYGKFASPNRWFDDINIAYYNYWFYVKDNGKYNVIDKDGNIICPELWFDDINTIYNGVGAVKLPDKLYYIFDYNEKEFKTQEGFDFVFDFCGGVAEVLKGHKYNLINTKGVLLSPNMWFDNVGSLLNTIINVEKDGKVNYLTRDGKLVSPDLWFDSGSSFTDFRGCTWVNYAIVRINRKCNVLFKNGKLLSPYIWFNSCTKHALEPNTFTVNDGSGYKDIKVNYEDTI